MQIEWSEVDWGNAPEWVGAIATGAAFTVAAVAFRRDVSNRRAAQARLVHAVTVRELTGGTPDEFGGMVLWRPDSPRPEPGAAIVRLFQEVVWSSQVRILHVKMSNGSMELIGPVLLRVVTAGYGPMTWQHCMDVMEPEHEVKFAVVCPAPEGPPAPPVDFEIAFMDSAGAWWKRRGTLPVQGATRRESKELAGTVNEDLQC